MKTIGNYTYSEETNEIGRGAFSRVYLGTHVHNATTKAAIKVMDFKQNETKTRHLLREVELMRHLRHVNVIRLIDVHYEKHGVAGDSIRLFLVMEYCGKGDLSSVQKPLPEEECRALFRQVFSGLRYLRSQNIVHRDLKPANILLTDDGTAKVADFTFSTISKENEMMHTMCGTPLTLAPEILLGEAYSDKCDLYSAGVMLYTLLYGSHPLGNITNYTELIARIKKVKISFPQKLVLERYEKVDESMPSILVRTVHSFSPECLNLMKGLLKSNQKERIAWELVFSDPWLQLVPLSGPSLDGEMVAVANSPQQDERQYSFSAPAPETQMPPQRPSLVPRSVLKRAPTKPLPLFPGESSFRQHSDNRQPDGRQTDGRQQMASESPSPANSTDLPFQMSDETSMQRQNSRLIMDYYNSALPAQPKEKPIEMRATTTKSDNVAKSQSSILSRSIEALQRVFTL